MIVRELDVDGEIWLVDPLPLVHAGPGDGLMLSWFVMSPLVQTSHAVRLTVTLPEMGHGFVYVDAEQLMVSLVIAPSCA